MHDRDPRSDQPRATKTPTLKHQGQTDPPLLWSIKSHVRALDEAFNGWHGQQIDYLRDQLLELGRQPDPMHPQTFTTLKRIDDLGYLSLKGGPLGKKNTRIYFRTDPARKTLVVLVVYKKEDEGAVPRRILERARRRWREYQQTH